MSQSDAKWNNFLISGFGRSGTLFLAKVLDQSPTWRVVHEPVAGRASLPELITRFSRHHYGEVNSYLRDWLPKIPTARKAIILRDPQAVAVSVFNRHPQQTPARLDGVWRLLDAYVEQGYPVFRFEEFTRCVDELQRIIQWTGIDDLHLPADFQFRPINATRRFLAASYDQIPANVRDEIDKEVSWFRRKYYSTVVT